MISYYGNNYIIIYFVHFDRWTMFLWILYRLFTLHRMQVSYNAIQYFACLYDYTRSLLGARTFHHSLEHYTWTQCRAHICQNEIPEYTSFPHFLNHFPMHPLTTALSSFVLRGHLPAHLRDECRHKHAWQGQNRVCMQYQFAIKATHNPDTDIQGFVVCCGIKLQA